MRRVAGAKARGIHPFEAQLATLVKTPPEGDGWFHEIKFDGYRMLCRVERGQVGLTSRNGKDWTNRFEPLAAAAARPGVRQAVLDGEIVVLDARGISHFQGLQNAARDKSAGFGALLLGHYRRDGSLAYAGRVGTGFGDRLLHELGKRLKGLERKQSPIADLLPGALTKKGRWVRPILVAQIEFNNWTKDGILRQAAFHGLREDKPANAVTRERPID